MKSNLNGDCGLGHLFVCGIRKKEMYMHFFGYAQSLWCILCLWDQKIKMRSKLLTNNHFVIGNYYV